MKSSSGYKRTPNAKCCICEKPLYRRPKDIASVRHVACMEHRAEAQKKSGITNAQLLGLSLGREKGTNHLNGIKKSEESKLKRSKKMQAWCTDNPSKVKERGEKIRGEKHYKWKGGASSLNKAIRAMTENRKWMDAVKFRDGECSVCGSLDDLESHHIIPISVIVESNRIMTTEDARNCMKLWDLSNGITVCKKCHYKIHGRKYED